MVIDLGCFKELYIEYKPIFAPISQKIKLSFFKAINPFKCFGFFAKISINSPF